MVKCPIDAGDCGRNEQSCDGGKTANKGSTTRRMSAAAALVLLAVACSAAAASESDALAVERGKYLATAGNCKTCHTSEDGEPFAGGVAFDTPFGKIYSTNITPDAATGIGKWSEKDFADALRKGVRPNGEHLYPVFPYTAYTKTTDADVAALFAYLQALKPVNSPARANELRFPYNQRRALGIWKALFFEEGRFTSDERQSKQWNRGKYLVEGLGHCSSCHSPRNFLGAEQLDRALTGGEYLDEVASGALRTWSAPNLTSASSGLASWPVEELASYLKAGRNGFVETYGPMNEVTMNSTGHLSEADTLAMATYLKALPAREGDSGGEPVSEEVRQQGSMLYDVHCGTCHLPTGLGDTDKDSGPRLVGNPVVQASNPASLINVILHGAQPPDPPLEPKRWKEMPAFAEKLTDDEIAAVASFVRNAWGNKGGVVGTEQVARQR